MPYASMVLTTRNLEGTKFLFLALNDWGQGATHNPIIVWLIVFWDYLTKDNDLREKRSDTVDEELQPDLVFSWTIAWAINIGPFNNLSMIITQYTSQGIISTYGLVKIYNV